MTNQTKNDCCNGCQLGKPGTNPVCKTKLMIDKMKLQEDVIKKK